jgi:predicted DNA-binding protein
MKNSNGKRTKQEHFLNMRLPADVWERLQEQANRQERTMAYLARNFIKTGLGLQTPQKRGA